MKLSNLKEARYYKPPHIDDVYKKYKSVEDRFDYVWGENSRGEREDELGQPYSLSHPLGIQAMKYDKYHGGSYVILEIMFHWDMPRDVGLKWVEKFANENKIPYSDIDVDDVDRMNDPTWAVTLTFDPEKFNK